MLTVPSFQEEPAPRHRAAEGVRRDGRRVARRDPRAPGARTDSRNARDARGAPRPSGVGRFCHSSASRRCRHCSALDAAVASSCASARGSSRRSSTAACAASRSRSATRLVAADRLDRPRRHLLPDRRRNRRCCVRRRDVPATTSAARCPAARRRTRRLGASTPPDTIELGRRRVLCRHASPRGSARGQPGVVTRGDGAEHLRGIGACGGRPTARAAILLDVTESHKLIAGRRPRDAPDRSGLGAGFPAHLRSRDRARRHAVARRHHRARVRHPVGRRREGRDAAHRARRIRSPWTATAASCTSPWPGWRDGGRVPRASGSARAPSFRWRVVIAGAASGGALSGARLGLDAAFALLLLAQFRSWDDLADRGRDALCHPERVLVRAASIAPIVAFSGALAILNICLAVRRDASGIAVGRSGRCSSGAAAVPGTRCRTGRTAAGGPPAALEVLRSS